MRSRNTYSVFTIFTAILIVVLGTGVAFGQGRGRGGDKGGGYKRGGGQSEQPRGQNKRAEQQQQRQERPQAQREQQQRQERPQAQREQQQRQERPQVQRQQQQRQERPQVQREQQQRQDRPQAQREQQQRQERQQIQREQPVAQWPNRTERGDNRNENRGEVRQERRDDRNSRRQVQPNAPWNNAWPNNYGAERSREVHERNAERKEWKNEERELRRYRSYSRSNDGRYPSYMSVYPSSGYYVNDPYVYQYQPYPIHQRASLLRSVISIVLGSNSGYGDNYYPQYQQAYGYNVYDQGYYGGDPYSAYPQYQYRSYAAEPYYYSYQPYSDIYYPQTVGAVYYQTSYMGNMQPGYYSDSALGGGYAPQQYSSLLALGYDQGYNDGLAARRAGYSDQYYSDPYAYENSNYVPYSYSVGTNRRCLSDGYELGYDDAYYDQRGNDRYQNGNIDLVSMLIGSALQML